MLVCTAPPLSPSGGAVNVGLLCAIKDKVPARKGGWEVEGVGGGGVVYCVDGTRTLLSNGQRYLQILYIHILYIYAVRRMQCDVRSIM